MDLSDAEQRSEWELRMSQMQMDVINKWIDARLKDEQRRWEPWKAIAAAMTAGVIMATALLSGGFWLAQHVH